MVHFLHILQMAFFLSLSTICFFGFGLPCLKRFFDNEITVREFVEKKTSLKPPAITVCPQKWKPDSPPIMPVGHYKKKCGDANDTQDFIDCVANKTFGIREVIVSATQGYQSNVVRNLSVSDPHLWTWDMTMAMVGRCYTLHYEQLLKVDQETDSIVVNLVPGNYYIGLHHPDFFLFTINPLTMPMTTVNLQERNGSYLSIALEQVQREKLNEVDVSKCNPNPDYKFTACIKQSLARTVNCSLPWNDRIAGFLPIELNFYFPHVFQA